MLGYLGTRVLGQYDVALLSAEAAPGPPALRRGEHPPDGGASSDVPLDDMRTWIALHETTHAYEFEAHAWLRPYLRERLERQLSAFLERPAPSAVGGLSSVACGAGASRRRTRSRPS